MTAPGRIASWWCGMGGGLGLLLVLGLAVVLGCASMWQGSGVEKPVLDVNRVERGCPEADHEALPAFDAYVQVDEILESITRAYPADIGAPWFDSMVMVKALVCEHGRVVETRVIRSTAGFDEAAEVSAQDAVALWRFKPAVAAGRNVAVWVTIPIRYRASR